MQRKGVGHFRVQILKVALQNIINWEQKSKKLCMIERQRCCISHIISAKQSVHLREPIHRSSCCIYKFPLLCARRKRQLSTYIKYPQNSKQGSPISSTDLNYMEKMERMVNHKSRFLGQHLLIDPRTSGSSPLAVANLSTFLSSSLVLTDSSEK